MALSPKQADALKALANGAGDMPAVTFARLRDLNLVEKAEGTPKGRGYTVAQLTEQGQRQVRSL
jgi:hypothetical protein